MTEYIVEMYDECEKYSSEYGCKPTNAFGFPLREEIVRCRDCVNYSGEDDEIYPMWCMENNTWEIEPDGFCKWGERRNK